MFIKYCPAQPGPRESYRNKEQKLREDRIECKICVKGKPVGNFEDPGIMKYCFKKRVLFSFVSY